MSARLNSVSYHVRVLRGAGTLKLVEQKTIRGTVEHFYVPDPVLARAAWVREVLGLPPIDGVAGS